MELLKVEFVPGDPPLLHVDGEVDLSTADQLRTALERALSTNPNVAIDMAGVTFVDACGLRVVLQVAASRNGSGPLLAHQRCSNRADSRPGRAQRIAFDRNSRRR